MALRLERFLPYRLNRAAAAGKPSPRIYRDEFGLTVPEWRVPATLHALGTASATEIGRDSAMHKTRVGRDRHIGHLSLTPAGQVAFRALLCWNRRWEFRLSKMPRKR